MALKTQRVADEAVIQLSSHLRDSFSGIIGRKFIDNYQVVQVKQPIVSLQKTTAIDIIVNAPEQVIGQTEKYNVELLAEFSSESERILHRSRPPKANQFLMV